MTACEGASDEIVQEVFDDLFKEMFKGWESSCEYSCKLFSADLYSSHMCFNCGDAKEDCQYKCCERFDTIYPNLWLYILDNQKCDNCGFGGRGIEIRGKQFCSAFCGNKHFNLTPEDDDYWFVVYDSESTDEEDD